MWDLIGMPLPLTPPSLPPSVQLLLFLQQMGPLHCASLLHSESG